MSKKIILFVFFLFSFQINMFLYAEKVPLNVQSALILKILGFNKTITDMPDKTVKVGILAGTNQDEVFSGFSDINGKDLSGKAIELSKIAKIEDAKGYHVVYVSSGNDAGIDSIIGFCQTNKIMSVSDEESYVQKGVVVGLIIEEGKPKIVVNQGGADKAGVKLSAQLLKVSKLI